MSRGGLFFALFALSACGAAAAPNASSANMKQASDPRLAQVAAITDRCGLPRSTLQLRGDELELKLPAGARYGAIDCMLREIRAAGLDLSTAIGFVGNEYPRSDNAQVR